MTPQERDMLGTLLDGLVAASAGRKDVDAEEMIRRAATRQPDAVYLLVQRTLLQEVALRNAQARIDALTRELEQSRSAPAVGGGSFLGGGWGANDSRALPAQRPGALADGLYRPVGAGAGMPGPALGAAPGYRQPSAFSGFLGSALTTAAGVAGGALLFQGIEHMINGGEGGLFGHAAAPVEVIENNTFVQDIVGNGQPDTAFADQGGGLFGGSGGWADDGGFDDGGDGWV